MLAQKTPIVALTLHFTESWSSLYFQELYDYKMQLFEDYKLRFLIINYLYCRRYWLRRLSIKRSNGLYFIGLYCLNLKQKRLLLPIRNLRYSVPFLEVKENSKFRKNFSLRYLPLIMQYEESMQKLKLYNFKIRRYLVVNQTKTSLLNCLDNYFLLFNNFNKQLKINTINNFIRYSIKRQFIKLIKRRCKKLKNLFIKTVNITSVTKAANISKKNGYNFKRFNITNLLKSKKN